MVLNGTYGCTHIIVCANPLRMYNMESVCVVVLIYIHIYIYIYIYIPIAIISSI